MGIVRPTHGLDNEALKPIHGDGYMQFCHEQARLGNEGFIGDVHDFS